MSTFKERLQNAIDSVMSDISAMSTEDIKKEVKHFIRNKKTEAIHYAWNYDAVDSEVSFDDDTGWTEFSTNCFEVVDVKIRAPNLFGDEPVNEFFESDGDYEQVVVSDDYVYRAAA